MIAAEAPAMAASLVADRQLRRRHTLGRIILWALLLAVALAILALAALLISVVSRGYDWLGWDLITSQASRFPERSGFQAGLLGTLWIIGLTALIAVPVGIGAAVYLEEYAPRNWWTRVLRTNISNLAGVPSVVYGLLGLGVFVNALRLDRSIIAGALTMALLILPVIIIASQEAIRAVPLSLRQAAFALGATKWQVAWHHVLPAAFPGILTGTILALSRAIGETAPLLVAGAALYVTFNPTSLTDGYTVLPVQIYNWTGRDEDFQDLAAAGIVLLLGALLALNAVAIYLRQRLTKTRW